MRNFKSKKFYSSEKSGHQAAQEKLQRSRKAAKRAKRAEYDYYDEEEW